MSFRLFGNVTSPNPQRSDSGPHSPPTATAEFFNLRVLLSSLWSLLPRPASPPPPARLCPPIDGDGRRLSRQFFRPYVAKVPWHGGVRAFLSQMFPRHGHYCGPNWSSGKDGGSLLWDRRPVDWLDFCCYCHDIGYDTQDQAKLLKADLAFLECLEQPRIDTVGDATAAHLYRSMCVYGLRNVLIPYRLQLVRLQGGPSVLELMSNIIGKNITFRKDRN